VTITGPVAEGETIAGKYVVGRTIAAGGMGVVCEGRHAALGQRVAIKFLLPEVKQQAEAVQRFVREARAAATIESDHVVRVLDVGAHGDVPYLVMEFLEGMDLEAFVEESGPLAPDLAIELSCQALEGLAVAHDAGIVHRDLKPSNLFLATRGKGRPRVKVLDFGVSKVMQAGQPDPSITSTKALLGSPRYMSPEQVRSSKAVDKRSDVWAMGVILWEILSGRKAFDGETLGDVFAKIREEPLPSIRALRPEISAELDAIVSRCLERDRERRFADAAAMLAALRELGAPSSEVLADPFSRAIEARTAFAPGAIVAAESSGGPAKGVSKTHSTWSTGDSARPSRRTLAGFAVLLVATAGLGAWLALRRGDPPKPAEVAEPSATSAASSPVQSAPAGPVVVVADVQTSASVAQSVAPSSAASSATLAPPSAVAAKPLGGPRPVPSATPAPKPSAPPPPASSKKKDDLGI